MYPNFPNQPPMQPGYPPVQPGYPPMQPGYPPVQPGYPPMQPGYPPMQPGYPPVQPGYPPMQPEYPSVQQAYPTTQAGMFPGQFQHDVQQQQHYTQQTMSASQPRPTIFRSPNFDASNDAALLRKAMKGFGTDENGLINVLCRRTFDERMEIVKAFKTAYGKDLIENIKKETSNNFQKLLVALCTPKIIYYCQELYAAFEGTGTDEDVLIEILCGGLPNREVQAIAFEYQRLYGKTFEEAIKDETSHSFKRLLVSLSTGNRDESSVTNIESARRDAQSLIDAGVQRFGTDESEFNRILCLRNFEQLKLISAEYEKLSGNSLEKDIKKEFSGDIEKGMVSVLRCATNRPLFFAKCIHEAVAGFGTNDSALIRLIITRSEIDMMDIKDEYQRKYKESLKDAIKGDTSGHYKHGLYALIGESRSS